MWSPRSIALAALLVLSACGFQPLYGGNDSVDAGWLASVEVERSADTRLDQLLSIAIQDSLNPKGRRVAPQFKLIPEVSMDQYPFVTNLDGSVSRFVIDVRSKYRLIRLADNKEIDSGELVRTASYNVSDNDDFATFVARQDAQERAMNEIAEIYRLKLRSYFDRYAGARGQS